MRAAKPQMTDRDEEIDLTNCDREPIHIPGRIQSFGCLLAVTRDWIVRRASANSKAFFEQEPDALIGRPLGETLSPRAMEVLRSRTRQLDLGDSVERIFGLEVGTAGQRLDVAMHRSGTSIILEFERVGADDDRESTSGIRQLIERLAQERDTVAMCSLASRHIRGLTGLDRVMVYRFDEDHSGEIIAEARRSDLEPYLNLRYPASDIPKQARALYERNLLRVLGDVDDPGVEIVPALGAEGDPLDLSMSTTRAPSPIHCEYLRNMGVTATLTISILRRGKLWGMFACHHMEPKVLGYRLRSTCELFAQLFSFILDQKENDREREQVLRGQVLHDQIMTQLAEGATIVSSFDTILDALEPVIPHDGAVCWSNGEFMSRGRTPSREEFVPLVPFLNTTSTGRVYAIDALASVFPDASEFGERAAGVLALPVSRTPRDYIVLFRQEVARSVIWAGNPDKPVEVGPNGARLTPRKSFDAWKEVVRGRSQPWSQEERRAAESVRLTLLEVVLRMMDTAYQERERAQEQQELLIAELNHRVRNILNLIKGLLSQGSSAASDVASFTSVIGGRVHALARAHDQLTQENWEPTSLHSLIRTEAEAYLTQKADRITIGGIDAMIKPSAYSTVALVVHELMTNAAKYGALADRHGRIIIDLTKAEDAALLISWREQGGPPMTPPKRRGFGSTVIERSIPFELRGTANVKYELHGLRASFMIPSSHVDSYVHPSSGMEEEEAGSNSEATMNIEGRALILEDNMIIALDAETHLQQMGFDGVDVFGANSDAINALEDREYSFALLDMNLGNETSETTAATLVERGIPFAFATGYGETRLTRERFPDAPVIQKPYDGDGVRRVVSSLLA